MRASLQCSFLAATALLVCFAAVHVTGQQYPFPQFKTSPLTGAVIPNHKTATALADDLEELYDDWKQTYLVQAGTTATGLPKYRVQMGSDFNFKTTSEAQGYGFLIVATMAGYETNARTIVDGLFYYQAEHRSEIDARLMDWSVEQSGIPDVDGNTAATDGDMDIAYGLMLAHAQWGSSGAVNYRAEALTILSGLLESCVGPNSHLPLLGDWVSEYPSPTHNEFTTRTSDHMYGHFATFSRMNANTEAVWNTVKSTTQQLNGNLSQSFSAVTGLLPDFVVRDDVSMTYEPAPPMFLESDEDGMYNWNAGRCPWRIGVDALVNDDVTSQGQVQNMIDWLLTSTGGFPANIASGYQLDGTPIAGRNWQNAFFVAPFAVAAAAAGEQAFLNQIWDHSLALMPYDYFGDSVGLLSLLAASGNFWDPTRVPGGEGDYCDAQLPCQYGLMCDGANYCRKADTGESCYGVYCDSFNFCLYYRCQAYKLLGQVCHASAPCLPQAYKCVNNMCVFK